MSCACTHSIQLCSPDGRAQCRAPNPETPPLHSVRGGWFPGRWMAPTRHFPVNTAHINAQPAIVCSFGPGAFPLTPAKAPRSSSRGVALRGHAPGSVMGTPAGHRGQTRSRITQTCHAPPPPTTGTIRQGVPLGRRTWGAESPQGPHPHSHPHSHPHDDKMTTTKCGRPIWANLDHF